MKPICRKTCADGPFAGPDTFHCGELTVVEDACGRYLQAAEKPLARFGYRFNLEAGKPHLLRVRYPDNRRRFMTVCDGTSYDVSCAVVTGHRWPLTNTMQQLEQIFRPRFHDFSLCFMTWGENEAAAVESFEVFELEEADLPPLELDSGGRLFGAQYEDPCGTQASEGAHSFAGWMDHVFAYLAHTGQNALVYPLCWYHGPWFPNSGEAAQLFSITVADDRNQYIAWSDHPADWPAELLARCDRENIEFTGEFTLLRLESLMKQMNIDLRSIADGAPTINNMLSNNMVQSGTMDWTVVYHSANYPEMLASDDPFNTAAPRKLAYGEQSRIPDCPVGPMFNVLHPGVQQTILAFFRETCRKYRRFRSFRGITVTMWAPTLLWFGSLRSGYDDGTCHLFEHETGITLPGSPRDPDRFRKRAEFLLAHHREQWINWRCGKIAAFLRKIRDAMVEEREDLIFSLTMWSEPFVPAVCDVNTPECQYGTRESCDQLYRNGGIDLALLSGEPNIEVMFQTDGGNRDRTASNRTQLPEAFHMFRDFDYLDDSVWAKLRKFDNSGVYVFNAWHEAWGEHRWFPAVDGDPNLRRLDKVYGGEADGMFRINSRYEPDGFWWDSQLRITPATPPGRCYLEHFAHALASGDALKITSGGLFLDKVHTELFREFARVFRKLPRKKFLTAAHTATDPVAVRHLTTGEATFVYCVNREPYPVEVELAFRNPPEGRHLADEAPFTGGGIRLAPYELAGIRLRPNELSGVQIRVDPEIVRMFREKLRKLPELPEAIACEIKEAFREGRYSRLRHLLSSYPAVRTAPGSA